MGEKAVETTTGVGRRPWRVEPMPVCWAMMLLQLCEFWKSSARLLKKEVFKQLSFQKKEVGAKFQT